MYIESNISNKISIENMIQNKFINEITICSKCGFFNGVVIDINHPSYYRFIKLLNYQLLFFICFDLMNANNDEIKVLR